MLPGRSGWLLRRDDSGAPCLSDNLFFLERKNQGVSISGPMGPNTSDFRGKVFLLLFLQKKKSSCLRQSITSSTVSRFDTVSESSARVGAASAGGGAELKPAVAALAGLWCSALWTWGFGKGLASEGSGVAKKPVSTGSPGSASNRLLAVDAVLQSDIPAHAPGHLGDQRDRGWHLEGLTACRTGQPASAVNGRRAVSLIVA